MLSQNFNATNLNRMFVHCNDKYYDFCLKQWPTLLRTWGREALCPFEREQHCDNIMMITCTCGGVPRNQKFCCLRSTIYDNMSATSSVVDVARSSLILLFVVVVVLCCFCHPASTFYYILFTLATCCKNSISHFPVVLYLSVCYLVFCAKFFPSCSIHVTFAQWVPLEI